MEENKRMELIKNENEKPKLIINMGKKNNDKINQNYVENASFEEIKRYVKEHTSGVKEHYDLAEGGAIIVSFSKFVEMINEGYNIYKSEVISEDFISIQYQKEIKREGRGR